VADYDNDGSSEIAFLGYNNKIVIAKKIQNYNLKTKSNTLHKSKDIIVNTSPFTGYFSIKIPEKEKCKSLTLLDLVG